MCGISIDIKIILRYEENMRSDPDPDKEKLMRIRPDPDWQYILFTFQRDALCLVQIQIVLGIRTVVLSWIMFSKNISKFANCNTVACARQIFKIWRSTYRIILSKENFKILKFLKIYLPFSHIQLKSLWGKSAGFPPTLFSEKQLGSVMDCVVWYGYVRR